MNFIKRWIEDFKLAIKVIKIMKRDLKENPRKLIADMQSTCDNSWLKKKLDILETKYDVVENLKTQQAINEMALHSHKVKLADDSKYYEITEDMQRQMDKKCKNKKAGK